MKKDIPAEIISAVEGFHANQSAYIQAVTFIAQLEAISGLAPDVVKNEITKLDDCTRKLGMSAANYFKANLFFSQVSALEFFLKQVVKIVVRVYPKKMTDVKFTISQILDAGPVDQIIERAADASKSLFAI